MAWTNSITPKALREIKGNLDSCYDEELQAYINALIVDVEYLTGLDFDFPAGTTNKTYRNTKQKNQFVVDGTILQIGAWQSVTQVERSYVSSSPSWSTLIEFDDYTLENPRIQGFSTINELYFLCDHIKQNEQIRITGEQGFSENIPSDLQYVMAEMVDAYYNNLESGIGAYDVTSERSLTRSVQYQTNGLTSLKLFTPARINELLPIIQKYNIKINYPY